MICFIGIVARLFSSFEAGGVAKLMFHAYDCIIGLVVFVIGDALVVGWFWFYLNFFFGDHAVAEGF